MKNIDYPVGVAFIALVLVCFGAGFFVGSSTVGEALSGFVLSIFSSYIFFFLTVTLKDRAEKKKIMNIVNPQLERIISKVNVAIHNSVLYPNTSCRPMPDVNKLSREELTKLLDVDLLNVPLKGFRSYYMQYDIKAETNIDQLILDTTLPIESQLERIKPYYYMLEHDIVKILTDIENSTYLNFSGQRLKYEKSFIFDQQLFLDFWVQVKKLEHHVDVKWH
jgi:hypothetical protein